MAQVLCDEDAAQGAQFDIQGINTANAEQRITAPNQAASVEIRWRQIEEAEQGA
ncbi:hypothetical protein HNP48_002690 [Acidovorax soli]|uniref:Uncharacterized protein n=1 Tax=Acidovorax soli TaxID=592050 RepID=A0A7X0PDP7_9BURK|nr:hypothetical protein [Acidovorax soli]MBB6560018.1 hypothetical protein [Acidovorax soli]